MKKQWNLFTILFILVMLIIVICLYGYNSGSCKRTKSYPCTDDFCLSKQFKVTLPNTIQHEIKDVLANKKIQKRVDIQTSPETLFHCALPNKKGITVATHSLTQHAPSLIHFYENELCRYVSEQVNLTLCSTDLNLPTSCVLLIYDREGDWINWHYDHNYYDGRFFTVLIPISQDVTCTEFQFKNDINEIKSVELVNGNSICFEGNYLYHRASKLCKNQKRVILSCQYVTTNQMNDINRMRLKLKDSAYTGKIFA